MNKITSLITAGLFGATMASQASTIVTTPTGLNPGDTYRLVFITSTTTAATSSDINTYNTFVNNHAIAAGLNTIAGTVEGTTTWTAIGSTADVDARDNINANTDEDGTGGPIYLLNDTLFAADYTALWLSDIPNQLNINESGDVVANQSVWTGSTTAGIEDVDSLGDSIVNYGANRFYNGQLASSYWISRNFSAANTTESSMYAMSGVLTVAVPEPSSAALIGLGGLALILRRRR